MPRLTLYTRAQCHLCEVAKEVLERVRTEHPFELTVFDVDQDPALAARYGGEVPVVLINDRKMFKYRIDPVELRDRLGRATRGEP